MNTVAHAYRYAKAFGLHAATPSDAALRITLAMSIMGQGAPAHPHWFEVRPQAHQRVP